MTTMSIENFENFDDVEDWRGRSSGWLVWDHITILSLQRCCHRSARHRLRTAGTVPWNQTPRRPWLEDHRHFGRTKELGALKRSQRFNLIIFAGICFLWLEDQNFHFKQFNTSQSPCWKLLHQETLAGPQLTRDVIQSWNLIKKLSLNLLLSLFFLS